VAGLQDSVVQALLSLHVVVLVVSHWPEAGLHASVVQRLLSLHVVVPVLAQIPVAGLQDSVVQRLLSVQGITGLLHAAAPCNAGSQTSFVHRLLSLQRTTGVLFGVVALAPGVFPITSWTTPPVYTAFATTKPLTMSEVSTV
jgi:hypothetical protein